MSIHPCLNVSTSKPRVKSCFLFGPFIGSLTYEMFQFAPYMIYLKKYKPLIGSVVFTRPSRFDLYGQYADILVPLRVREDLEHESFTIDGFQTSEYDLLKDGFRKQFKKKYNVKGRFCPNIESFRFKLKWQFPRYLMDYGFMPRLSNQGLLSRKLRTNPELFVDLSGLKNGQKQPVLKQIRESGYSFVNCENLNETLDFDKNDLNVSLLGCVILLLKGAQFTIGNLRSPISHLSLLLGTPVISIHETLSKDSVNLMNPLNSRVIYCEDIEEGLQIASNI